MQGYNFIYYEFEGGNSCLNQNQYHVCLIPKGRIVCLDIVNKDTEWRYHNNLLTLYLMSVPEQSHVTSTTHWQITARPARAQQWRLLIICNNSDIGQDMDQTDMDSNLPPVGRGDAFWPDLFANQHNTLILIVSEWVAPLNVISLASRRVDTLVNHTKRR